MTMCIWWYIPGHTDKIQGQPKLKEDRKQDSRVYIPHCESESYGGAWKKIQLPWPSTQIFGICWLEVGPVIDLS